MARKPQGPATHGSQRWLQEVVNNKPSILNTPLIQQLSLNSPATISWLSPLKNDDYAEYQDQSFLDILGIKLEKVPLPEFWPTKGGPQWDALGKSKDNRVFLVEAKSHIPEAVTPATGAKGDSLIKIQAALSQTKRYLNAKPDIDWSATFYQYTNRLAHLYLLRVLNQIPAYLVFVYFLNDHEMDGPGSVDEWRGALKLLHYYMGLGKNKLQKYIVDVYIDVDDFNYKPSV
jgi:hypothetical protein